MSAAAAISTIIAVFPPPPREVPDACRTGTVVVVCEVVGVAGFGFGFTVTCFAGPLLEGPLPPPVVDGAGGAVFDDEVVVVAACGAFAVGTAPVAVGIVSMYWETPEPGDG